MPIRRELRHFYQGPHWQAVRARILARAGNQCERCGKPNGRQVIVARDGSGGWRLPGGKWRGPGPGHDYRPGQATPRHLIRAVLTIAHLNHVAGDDRDENLQALCQWCHFKHDVRFHHANARRTRAARVGQAWLTPEMERVL